MARLVVPLRDVGAGDVDLAGGKGANLGELMRAGFAVPEGFILTTEAYALAAAGQVQVDGERLRNQPVPGEIAQAARSAYAALRGGPVAVRSSATAEDLPGASFAGQQDTYLNIVGEDALLEAIRNCWASLWNERAVAYRQANGVDNASVRLAVVVQRMVDASAAGVLFTANPLTGLRRTAAIEAVADLGEKLVSGAANPDHYVVDTATGAILERKPSGVDPVVTDGELELLARTGDAVERHFGLPQDIEFAFDQKRELSLVQARPITTLYPLPAQQATGLRVYFSANVFQGYFEPLTPMGTQFFQLLGSAVVRAFGGRVEDALAGPDLLAEAAMRLFADITGVIRNPLGRRVVGAVLAAGEARAAAVLERLGSDARLSLRREAPIRTAARLVRVFARSGIAGSALRVFLAPEAARACYVREMERITRIELPASASASERLDAFEWLLVRASALMLPRLLGIMAPAMLTLGLSNVLVRGRARADELQTMTLSAPGNPTTEMDLALWSLAASVRADAESRTALAERTPADLAAAYRRSELPARLQAGLAAFLGRYGFRAIGEIDIGVARWSEDPTHILGALANYLRLAEDALAPDAQFARGQRQAEAMIAQVVARVHGPRRLVLRVVLGRFRRLIGAREAPKFHIIRLLATPSRELLAPVGVELAARGTVAEADDIFFLRLDEARRAVAGEDFHDVVAARRATFAREHARRHIPRVLLSDGTDAEAALVAPASDGLHGAAASPGVVTAAARVILDPRGARLEPGEILVAPSTDPGWTPLFLTAGGLVMEMGGIMSHGAVVAREYGIPAVVGVDGATRQIVTGQEVTVDGFAGSVTISEPPSTTPAAPAPTHCRSA